MVFAFFVPYVPASLFSSFQIVDRLASRKRIHTLKPRQLINLVTFSGLISESSFERPSGALAVKPSGFEMTLAVPHEIFLFYAYIHWQK